MVAANWHEDPLLKHGNDRYHRTGYNCGNDGCYPWLLPMAATQGTEALSTQPR